MKTYARIVDGIVWEIVHDFDGFTIEQIFAPDFVAELVEITEIEPVPEQNWTYDGSSFSPPGNSAAPED